MSKTTKSTPLFLFAIVVLICTVVLAGCTANGTTANPEDWIRAKKEGAISCRPNKPGNAMRSSNQELNGREQHQLPANDNGPAGKHQGNGCSHQPGAGTLCEWIGPKLRHLKVHNC
jgi:hypothetical protein